MVMTVDAESPETPVATMVYDAPCFVSDGIVTLVEKVPGEGELAELAVGVPKVAWVPRNVNVIDSLGSKLIPSTVKNPPGAEHPEVVVIPTALGS
jgi:hypothetical protein